MGHLSPSQSTYLSGLFPLLYLGSVYLRKQSRLYFAPNPKRNSYGARIRVDGERWRDDDAVIKARLYAVCFSTFCSVIILAWIIYQTDTSSQPPWITIRLQLGFVNPPAPLLAYTMVPLLYMGPLYYRFLLRTLPFQHRWSVRSSLLPIFNTWPGLRNWIAAPITEELVFRSCVLATMRLAEQSTTKKIFLSPLWFGIAHLHHTFELFDQGGRTTRAFQHAFFVCAIQLTYTTVFGWITAFLWLRSGSVFPCITSHIFCNLMGLPTPGADARVMPKRRTSIWTMHLVGVVAFISCIWRLNQVGERG